MGLEFLNPIVGAQNCLLFFWLCLAVEPLAAGVVNQRRKILGIKSIDYVEKVVLVHRLFSGAPFVLHTLLDIWVSSHQVAHSQT